MDLEQGDNLMTEGNSKGTGQYNTNTVKPTCHSSNKHWAALKGLLKSMEEIHSSTTPHNRHA